MSDLYFKVGADYSEVQKLRSEITLLQNKLRNFTPGQSGPSLKQLQSQLAEATTRMRQLTDAAARAGADIEGKIRRGVDGAIHSVYKLRNALQDPLTATLSIAGVGALGGLLNQITRVRSNFQEMRTSIDVLLGSETKGEKLMGQLTDFAKVSPLDFQGVVGAAKQMLGFNIEAQKVPEYLRAIGDISMGNRARFNQLTLAFSQMSVAGKLMGQDLMQMVNAGFQPLQIMAEKTGKSIGELKDEMSKGKISSEMVQQAFLDATAAGGKYYQMSEKASQTITGQLSMLEDAFDLLYNDLGQKAEGTVVKIIETATMLVENYEKFLPTIGAIIATFGVYKTTAMAAAYAEKAAQEHKNEAVRKGFEAELNKMEELRRKRRELAREQLGDGSNDPYVFTKGARYDSSKSKALADQLNPGLGQSSTMLDDVRKRSADEKKALAANLKSIDEQIAKKRKTVADLDKQINADYNKLDKLLKQHDAETDPDKKSKLMDDVITQENYISSKEKSRKFQLDSIDSLQNQRQGEIDASEKIQESLEKEKEKWLEIADAEKALSGSEGSMSLKKNQLAMFEQAYEAMSPSEQASAFGQELHEQIEGLRADIEGIANLDSDLSDALDLGSIESEEAQVIQNARNELDDYITSLEEEKTALEDVANNSTDATERQNAATRLNTITRQLNEAQTERDTLAADRESAARARNTAQTNANTAATGRNSVALVFHTAKSKLAAVGLHLVSAAQQTATRTAQALKAAWMTNPFGLILTGVTAVISAVTAFSKTEEVLADEANETMNATVKTRDSVESLYAVLSASDRNSKTYKESLDELTKIAKDYGIQIENEANAHDELIGKKERLIQLIMEEGRQRQITANIESLMAEKKKARDNTEEELSSYVKGKHAATLIKLMLEEAEANADKILALDEQINEALRKSDFNTASSLRQKQNELVTAKAQIAAKELGVSLDMKGVDDANLNNVFSHLAEGVTDATRGVEAYTKAVNSSKNAVDALADKVREKPLKDLTPTDLGKEMKKAALAMDELQKNAGKNTEMKIDTSAADKAVELLKKTNRSLDDTGENRTISLDDSEIVKSKDESVELKNKMDDVDNANARPIIDDESILNAISQLQMVELSLKRINGEVGNGFSTVTESARIKELEAQMHRNEKGQLVGPKNVVEEYQRLIRNAKSRTSWQGNDLTSEQAQIMEYFRGGKIIKRGGRIDREATERGLKPFQTLSDDGRILIDKSKMTEEERMYFTQVTRQAKKAQAVRDANTDKLKWQEYQKEIVSRIAKARTENELDPIRKELSAMTGDLAIGGAQKKWVEKQIENIQNKTKKSSDDPRQREYDKQKAKLEDEKKERREREDVVFAARELEISKKIDSSEKELASIKLKAEKQRVQLERQLEDKVQQMKEFDRSQWLKDFPAEAKKKNYMWQQSMSDEEYANLAKERLGYDTQSDKINNEEETSTTKILKSDREAMNQYLIEYGTFEERRAAMAEYYAEKIKNAKNEAERLQLEREYNDKTLKADRDSYVQLLKEYGDYEQKKLAISLEYQEKMRNASPIEKASLELSKRNDVEALDRQYGRQWKDTAINPQMFEYLDDLNLDVLEQLRLKLNALMKDSTASVEDLNEASAKLGEVANAISSRKSEWKNLNPFRNPNADRQEALERNAQSKRTLADTLQEKANQKTEELNDTIEKIISMLGEKGVSATSDEIKSGKTNPFGFLSLFEKEGKEAFGNLVSKFNTQTAEVAKAGADAANAVQGAEAAEGAAGGGGDGAAFAVTDKIIHTVNQNLQSMPVFLDKLGLDDTEFGKGMKDFAESSQYATAAFDSLKSGDFVGVISNLHSAFGSLGNVLGRLGIAGMGSSDKNLSSDIDKLTMSNEALRYAISELANDLKEVKFTDIEDVYQSQKSDLEKTVSNTREMMQRSASVYSNGFLGIGGKKSANHKIDKKMSGTDWDRISKAVGHSVTSASQFFSLTSEEMANVAKKAPDLYAKIKDIAADGYGECVQYMDEYIELYKQMDELTVAFKEAMTDVTFDNVVDQFKSTLLDMESTSYDFAQNFEKMMQQAVVNSMMKETYSKRLEAWYDKFSESMSTGGGLSIGEQNDLREEYQNIVRNAIDQRNRMMDMMGWDSSYSQSSGANAYKSMSQDTAEEMNGRLTAIAVTTESIRQQDMLRDVTLATLNNSIIGMINGSNAVLEQAVSVATTLAKTSLDIAEIRDNTYVIIKPIKEISTHVKEIKENIKNI